MLTQHIALVPEVGGINTSELARVSAALQKQVTRDLFPLWNVSATVDAFPHLEDVPVGYWPIILAFGDLGTDEGVHLDQRGQPYAVIEMSPSWSLTASHVCIEMLIDPYGNRTVVGPSPRSDQGSVEFFLDVCNPCEDARYAYTVNDVLVSDFCTPEFLAQIPAGKERYSFTGAIEAPFQVLPGGGLSWYDPASNRFWQRDHFGNGPRDTDLGFIERRAGRRLNVNHAGAPKHLAGTKMTLEAFESRMGIPRQRALHASLSQAHLLRVHLGNPGAFGSLVIDATEPTRSDKGAREARTARRPRVLSALTKASIGATSAEGPRDDGPRPPKLPQEVRAPDPRLASQQSSAPAPFFGEPDEARHPALARRASPPPMPRSATPDLPPAHSAPTTSLGRSIAPTAMNVNEAPVSERPAPSARDRLVLAGAVAAACVVGLAIYSSSSVPNRAPASSAVSTPAPPAAPSAPSGAARPAELNAPTKAATDTTATAAPAARRITTAAARATSAPTGPDPKRAKAVEAKEESTNPYDDPPAAASDGVDRL